MEFTKEKLSSLYLVGVQINYLLWAADAWIMTEQLARLNAVLVGKDIS